jgi:hypothetical protein
VLPERARVLFETVVTGIPAENHGRMREPQLKQTSLKSSSKLAAIYRTKTNAVSPLLL